MPLFVGAWLEALEQIRVGRRLDQHIKTLRRWQVAEPLELVPQSLRARAERDLRVGEYLAALGDGTAGQPALSRLAEKVEEAQMNFDKDAAAKLERDRETLRAEPASKLDVAQLVVDMLALGRTWTEHFNDWSREQKAEMEQRIARQDEEIGRLRQEIAEMRSAIPATDPRRPDHGLGGPEPNRSQDEGPIAGSRRVPCNGGGP
jgi:hypothetical protein